MTHAAHNAKPRMEFYNNHSEEFSRTRFRVWPCVRQFLRDLSSDAKVLDIGSGNGKNMLARPELQTIGIESSAALCAVCRDRGLEVICGDARALPFRDGAFDAVMMIAVLHHLPPCEHMRVLCEIQRVLRPRGVALITNWAVEQPADARRVFTAGLNIVKWKGTDAELPYWVMDAGGAREFAGALPHGLVCLGYELEAGNWVFRIQRD
jgi:SAM-dependent methyltransferase